VKRLIIATILLAAVTALGAQTTATIRDLKGKVEVKPLGKNWVLAKDGMVVDTLATISTGFDSSATLLIGKNKVGIAPLTRLTVDKIVEKAGKLDTSLHLRVGKVSAEVKSSSGTAQDFKVTSPYSTASVRGTRFDYDGFLVRVADGTVAFIPGKPNRDIVVFAPKKKAAPAAAAPTGDAPPADGETPPAEGGIPPAEGGEASPEQAGEDAEYEAFLADLLVQIQEQFPDENFDIVTDEVDAAPPAPVADPGAAPTEGSGDAPAPIPTPAPAQAPAVFVEKGASAVITQDFSLIQVVGGKISPASTKITTTNAAGQSTTTTTTTTPVPPSTDESGGGGQSGPVVPPPPAPKTGTIVLTW